MARCVLLLLLWLTVAPAAAHTLSVTHLDITLPANGRDAQLEIDLAIRDLVLSLPLDANRDEQVTWGELDSAHDQVAQFVLSGLSLSSDAGRCELRPGRLATRRYDDGAYATLQLAVRCPSAIGWRLRYDLLFPVDPQHRALITLREDSAVHTVTARADAREIAVHATGDRPVARAAVDSFVGFLREGMHHILIGYDHLAFLLSLLLPAALLRQRDNWRPATGFRGPLLQVLGIVTAFTLAHSITLSLAALGWVTPSSRWVEPAIAASILLAAVNNVRPLVTQRLWVVGFVFGLVHGFGFAGALDELGLPRGTRLLALLGFNLGVELGQLLVVCLALPCLFALRGQRWYAHGAMPLLSLGIGALAVSWLWQRLP
ncbi:MAG TPA: HupE/UreJ family protein [Lysobacter sp.]|nr:HupE/UreJ family protein [Lysobacter sp.]